MTTPAKPFEFDKALKELEDITQWFEQSDTDLDAGLIKFERGMELATQLKAHLAGVENRIEKIKQKFSAAPTAPTTPANTDLPEPSLLPSDSPGQTDIFES
jgi:exodeoxyribonuclease VII small subunit